MYYVGICTSQYSGLNQTSQSLAIMATSSIIECKSRARNELRKGYTVVYNGSPRDHTYSVATHRLTQHRMLKPLRHSMLTTRLLVTHHSKASELMCANRLFDPRAHMFAVLSVKLLLPITLLRLLPIIEVRPISTNHLWSA